jgi:hypothetical protein
MRQVVRHNERTISARRATDCGEHCEAAGAVAQSRVSASIFDIGQSTLGLEGFSYGCKHLKYALTAPGTHRCNGDWPYGSSSQCRR